MIHRIAASLALIVFAVCLVEGGLRAGNSFSTTVWRALVALAGTYIIGLVLGKIARIMLDENLKDQEEKLKKSQKSPDQ